MSDVRSGSQLPVMEIPITPVVVVGGAIATRDFQPVHHDREAATDAGAKDIFMNILTTNGLVGRYITDWAGPKAVVRSIKIRLGAPNHPGDTMVFSGSVDSIDEYGNAQVAIEGRNSLGVHVSGAVDVRLDGQERVEA